MNIKNKTSLLERSRLQDEAHLQSHQMWSRRDFLSAFGLFSAGSLALGNSAIHALQPNPLWAALANGNTDRILVLIRLDGGNDGLNTIVERNNPSYYNLRPNIAISDNQLWALSNQYGMPFSTFPLQPFWKEGQMKTIFNVGYPQPNYSHFRSYDIIASGSDSDVVLNTGWLGRFLDNEYPVFLETPPSVPPALQIGVQADLLFRSDQLNMGLAVSSPQEFYSIAQSGQLYNTTGLGNTARDQELAFVRQTANAAFRYADSVQNAYNRGKNQVNYPSQNTLAEQLAIVARLIKGNLGTQIFMVKLAGFDTHAQQFDFHQNLLSKLSEAIKAFYDDLSIGGKSLPNKVLSMTFSEFGRTIYENASLGTDHGWGTPVLLFGGNIGQGFAGQYQDLGNPDPLADPPFSIDFRAIYATILQDWMGAHADVVRYILGNQFPIIPGLVPSTAPESSQKCVLLGHNPHPGNTGVVQIKYAMKQPGQIRLQILDKAGYPLRTLVHEFKPAGSYILEFQPSEWYLTPGNYRYRLQSGGQVFERNIKL